MRTFSDCDPAIHGISFPRNAKPSIQPNHIDGPLLHFSDGQLHWLTPWERFLLWLGKTDAATLQRKLRPNLTRLMEVSSVVGWFSVLVLTSSVFAQDIPHAEIPSAFDAKKITLGQVREIQMALASIETRDGKPVPTCLGDIKAPCIPLAISSAIADDLAALSPHWVFYQNQAHKLIGDASGGTGYLAPGSKEETVANYRLFELNGQPVTVRIRPVDVNGLEASGVQVPPTIKAVLAPVSR
jgi:hypothetical protein